jgi:soluble lytic murein transglycosylase-like protein
MSTQALQSTGMPADEAAVAARIQQIQQMMQQARAAATGAPAASSPSTSFDAALRSATASAASYPGAAAPVEGTQYDAAIEQAARRNGLDPALLHGLIQQESGFDPSSQSGAGAMGLAQLMPGTASSLGVANPMDPVESIEGGARYLSQMMREFGGNSSEALAAYNAGPAAVHQYGGIPPYAETQSYVTKVLGYAEAYRRSHPTTEGMVL